MSKVSIDLFVNDDRWIQKASEAEPGERIEITTIEVDVPVETIYTIAGESDGYITTWYSRDERLLEWYYEADSEAFGSTDSQSSFECAFFPEYLLSDVNDIMGAIISYCRPSALEYLRLHHPELEDKWRKEWKM